MVRVALVYLAVAWGVSEGSDTLTSVLGLPAVTPRVVFALAVLGFPVAVVLAWAYQLTPDGVERAEASRATGRFNLPFLGGLAVGIVALCGLAFVFSGLGEGDGGAGPTFRSRSSRGTRRDFGASQGGSLR